MKAWTALIALAFVFIVMFATPALAVDATVEWDGYSAQYNFPTVDAATLDGTFETEYFGQDFATDFRSILDAVAQALGTSPPHYMGDDELKAGIENWPDP